MLELYLSYTMDFTLQILNSSANLVIFSLDCEYRYTLFNVNHANIMRRLWKVEVEEGKSMLDFICNDNDRLKAKNNFDRVLAGETFSEIDESGDSSIHRLHFINNYSPLYDDKHQVSGLTVFTSNLSEKKIVKTQNLFESLDKYISEGVYRSDEEKLFHINPAFLRMFGYKSKEEVFRLEPSTLYKDPSQRLKLIEILNRDGFFVNEEVTFLKKSGVEFLAFVSGITHTDPSGKLFFDGAIRDVTIERKANKKVKENEQLLQSINHNINEAIYRSEQGKGLIYVNEAFVKMFGFESSTEIIESDVLDLYRYSQDRDRLQDELVKKNSHSNLEVEFKRKNGTIFWGSLSSIVIENDGKIFFDGAIRDITERKKVERRFYENRKLLESINENISEGIYRSNKDGLVYVNKAFVDLFGYQSEIDLLKKESLEFYKDQTRRKELVDILEKFGSFENEEITFLKKGGKEFTGLISSTSYKDSFGRVFWDGAIRDISLQKEAENKIKMQTKMQRMLTDISMQYINIHLDKIDKTIRNSLRELGVFAGSDRTFIFDMDYKKKVFNNTHEWCREGIPSVLDRGQNIPFDIKPNVIEFFHAGKPFIIDETTNLDEVKYEKNNFLQDAKTLIAVPCMNGSICVGIVGFDYVKKVTKITDNEIVLLDLFAQILVNIQVETLRQKERQQLLDTATSQNKRLKAFSFITSHNIRSSVANFLGLLAIQKHDPMDAKIGDMLQTTAQKLNNTITNINDLLNFENDIESLSKVECNLTYAIRQVIDQNDQIIKNKNIRLELDVPENTIVQGIPSYLGSILNNCLENAIKYGTNDESKKITIRVVPENDGHMVLFEDFGPGIDLEKYGDKLFKVGTRFHSDKKDGQGLGLFMVKRHVEAMGGTIDVQSELNKGTTFKVWFHV